MMLPKKRELIEKLLNKKDEEQEIDIDSLNALFIVSDQNSLDSELICNLLKSFLIDLQYSLN